LSIDGLSHSIRRLHPSQRKPTNATPLMHEESGTHHPRVELPQQVFVITDAVPASTVLGRCVSASMDNPRARTLPQYEVHHYRHAWQLRRLFLIPCHWHPLATLCVLILRRCYLSPLPRPYLPRPFPCTPPPSSTPSPHTFPIAGVAFVCFSHCSGNYGQNFPLHERGSSARQPLGKSRFFAKCVKSTNQNPVGFRNAKITYGVHDGVYYICMI
jgi:hypothetical protein